MKCRYAKCLLWFMLGAVTSIVIYMNFFTDNTKWNWQNLHHQAYTALHDEKYEHAIEICDRAIKASTSSVDKYQMYVKKGKTLNKLHRYEKALENADSAVAIYPKKEEAYLVKVDALFNLGREEELTTILEEVISINPRTSYKPLLNFLRLDRGKANY